MRFVSLAILASLFVAGAGVLPSAAQKPEDKAPERSGTITAQEVKPPEDKLDVAAPTMSSAAASGYVYINTNGGFHLFGATSRGIFTGFNAYYANSLKFKGTDTNGYWHFEMLGWNVEFSFASAAFPAGSGKYPVWVKVGAGAWVRWADATRGSANGNGL
jgi:hypothetical protein